MNVKIVADTNAYLEGVNKAQRAIENKRRDTDANSPGKPPASSPQSSSSQP